MKKAVVLTKGRVLLEASGGVTLETIGEIAKTGVNLVSVGALTHSARSVDISLKMV
jgi:nicotinate-nucleotide pyrophosphorylase (carboxylating)